MIRDISTRIYAAPPWQQTTRNGLMHVSVVNNIPQSWAISRPVSAPTPRHSPPVGLQRGSSIQLYPSKPNVMMDPSDPSTWQRQYRFT